MRWWRSLRVQLAVIGFLAIYVPVVVLFGVVVVTDDVDVTSAEVGASSDAVEADENVEITGAVREARSPWVTATALALAPAAAVLSWWLAGRAVRPIERVRRVAEEIEATDLSRRIALEGGTAELASLASSFDAMLDRLEAAAETQQQLIEEASHELRTPLSVLTTNADVLLSHPDPSAADYRAAIERSQAAARRMQAALEELLVDARGRARTINLRPVDLAELVHEVVAGSEALAADRSTSLRVASDGLDAVPAVRVDASMVHRAIGNLVENAIHHAPGGSTVTVALRSVDERVAITVTDDGPGIPADEQAAIFERAWRGEASTGTGLGLPIARQVARAHGGDVSVESPVEGDRGTCFELTLRR